MGRSSAGISRCDRLGDAVGQAGRPRTADLRRARSQAGGSRPTAAAAAAGSSGGSYNMRRTWAEDRALQGCNLSADPVAEIGSGVRSPRFHRPNKNNQSWHESVKSQGVWRTESTRQGYYLTKPAITPFPAEPGRWELDKEGSILLDGKPDPRFSMVCFHRPPSSNPQNGLQLGRGWHQDGFRVQPDNRRR